MHPRASHRQSPPRRADRAAVPAGSGLGPRRARARRTPAGSGSGPPTAGPWRLPRGGVGPLAGAASGSCAGAGDCPHPAPSLGAHTLAAPARGHQRTRGSRQGVPQRPAARQRTARAVRQPRARAAPPRGSREGRAPPPRGSREGVWTTWREPPGGAAAAGGAAVGIAATGGGQRAAGGGHPAGPGWHANCCRSRRPGRLTDTAPAGHRQLPAGRAYRKMPVGFATRSRASSPAREVGARGAGIVAA